MKLDLKKPLVFFDLETTGMDVVHARIVELSYLKIFPDHREEVATYRVNPGVPIPAETTLIHGIGDDDVRDAPTFSEVGHELANAIRGCDLAGFNLNKFDLPVLAEEFIRAKIDFDLNECKLVDVQVIFYKMEQRTLSAAYKFYCNKELANAHNAEVDARATYEVLQAQMDKYADLQNNVDMLSRFSTHHRYADFAGRIAYNDKNEEVFNFGKHKGKTVSSVFKKEPAYYSWMLNSDFPQYTKNVLTSIKLRENKK